MYDKTDYTKVKELAILNVADKVRIQIIDSRAKNNEVIGRCPFCGDSKNQNHGHLSLNILKNTFRCTKCGEHGSSLQLYEKIKIVDGKTAFRELVNGNISENALKTKPVPESKIIMASIKRRNEVYTALLSMLPLYENHKQDLLKRGLSEQQIIEFKCKSATVKFERREEICYQLIKKGLKLNNIPGFYKDDNDKWNFFIQKGYFIPCLDKDGYIQGLQIRLDDADKNKYRWFSSKCYAKGTAASGFVNVAGVPGRYKKCYIVEGILKSKVCQALNPSALYLGIPSANAHANLIMLLKELKIDNPFTAIDMDKTKNKYVAAYEKKLIAELLENDIKAKVYNWDPSKGKGLDDYMLTIKNIALY